METWRPTFFCSQLIIFNLPLIGCLVLALTLAQAQVFTPDDAKAVLKKHNEYRREEAASDMYLLHWNVSLQQRADSWAHRCLFKHERNLDLGENLYFDTDHENGVMLRGLEEWHKEKSKWGYTSQSCSASCHFTQLIWGYTTTVGCSAHVCPTLNVGGRQVKDAMFLVCYYYPRGNFIGNFPYSRGRPCSSCAVGDSCSQDLCVSSGPESKLAPDFVKMLVPQGPLSISRSIHSLDAFRGLIQQFTSETGQLPHGHQKQVHYKTEHHREHVINQTMISNASTSNSYSAQSSRVQHYHVHHSREYQQQQNSVQEQHRGSQRLLEQEQQKRAQLEEQKRQDMIEQRRQQRLEMEKKREAILEERRKHLETEKQNHLQIQQRFLEEQKLLQERIQKQEEFIQRQVQINDKLTATISTLGPREIEDNTPRGQIYDRDYESQSRPHRQGQVHKSGTSVQHQVKTYKSSQSKGLLNKDSDDKGNNYVGENDIRNSDDNSVEPEDVEDNVLASNQERKNRKQIRTSHLRKKWSHRKKEMKEIEETHPHKVKYIDDTGGRRCVDRHTECERWAVKCHKSSAVTLACPMTCGKCGLNLELDQTQDDQSGNLELSQRPKKRIRPNRQQNARAEKETKRPKETLEQETQTPGSLMTQSMTVMNDARRGEGSNGEESRRLQEQSRQERQRHAQDRRDICRDDPKHIKSCRFWSVKGFCLDNRIIANIYCRHSCKAC